MIQTPSESFSRFWLGVDQWQSEVRSGEKVLAKKNQASDTTCLSHPVGGVGLKLLLSLHFLCQWAALPGYPSLVPDIIGVHDNRPGKLHDNEEQKSAGLSFESLLLISSWCFEFLFCDCGYVGVSNRGVEVPSVRQQQKAEYCSMA